MRKDGLLTCITLGIMVFVWAIIIYVSIPDYPYSASSCEVFLWSEKSGWWSEITWILVFGISAVCGLTFLRWQKKPNFLRTGFRIICLASVTSFIFHFLVRYWGWTGIYEDLILDRHGWLHGAFYLLSLHSMVWSIGEGMFQFDEMRK